MARRNLPHRDLPANYRIRNAKNRKAQQSTLPKWVIRPDQAQRIFDTWEMYLKRTPIQDIARSNHVSIQTVYDDLKKAKAFRVEVYAERLNDIISEQIDAHEQIIRECRHEIQVLRADRNPPPPNQDEMDEVMQALMRPSTADTSAVRAIAELLKIIASEEHAIEKLIGLHQGPGITIRTGPQEDEISDDIDESKQLVIDARVMVSGTPDTRPTIDATARTK